MSHDRPKPRQRAFLAFGSNIGDAEHNIEQALRDLDRHREIRVVRTSGLYKTKAMYVEDQADFTNGVCEIETSLEPLELLDACQQIERDLGRIKTIDKGPRNIDLDILLYDERIVAEERLIVPHKLMLERAFVLQPLCELIPDSRPPPQGCRATFLQLLQKLPRLEAPMSTQVSLGVPGQSLRPLQPDRETKIMAILNVTPDSFSDGGNLYSEATTAEDKLKTQVRQQLERGATIFDIGGQSTRPHAEDVGAEEEVRRVIPAVRAVREALAAAGAAARTVISVDTYRAEVARAAIGAGAHLVNDVSGGTLDGAMLPTVAALGCPVVLMHMRGNPETMSAHTQYAEGVVATVARELLERVAAAERAGVRRWRIVVDPGIGFAKTQAQNVELLRRLDELRAWPGLGGLAWLVGPSRKGFIGAITGVERAAERAWGTAAAVAAAVQGGADIVRVHDVGEMRQVAQVADAIWRA